MNKQTKYEHQNNTFTACLTTWYTITSNYEGYIFSTDCWEYAADEIKKQLAHGWMVNVKSIMALDWGSVR